MSDTQLDQREELLKRLYYDLDSHGSFGGQETYTNFRVRRKNFQRLAVLVDRIDEQWQADLMDMSYWSGQNDGVNHLLVVIDILSRFAWIQPCRDKAAPTIINAFSEIFSSGRKPEKLQTDQGREFNNNRFKFFCTSQGVHYFTTTDASIKCALAERLIRTLRSRIYRFIYHKHTHRYIDDLQNIVNNYNNSYHRTIKTAPNSVTQDNQQSIVAADGEETEKYKEIASTVFVPQFSDGKLMEYLGFSPSADALIDNIDHFKQEVVVTTPLYHKNNVNLMYVYTDIIRDHAVGGTKAPVLRAVPLTTGIYQGIGYCTFEHRIYYPVRKNHIENIAIFCLDDTGEQIKFANIGRVFVSLDFRKKN
uniref:Integrase catalytic domain-containing protein n=1 Tax=Tetranychus urticae TaxID=32264 RepID=A0A158P4P5_TETUR